MNIVAFVITLVYLAGGLLEYYLAPRLGPNPYFGFRIGYTMSNRDVWNRANRWMGKVMTLHAILLIPISLFLGMTAYLVLFLVPFVAFIPLGIKYAATLLEEQGARAAETGAAEPEPKKIAPISLGILWIISPMLFYSALLLVLALTYQNLPPVIAVHFTLSGVPDGWASRESFVVNYAAFSLIMPLIAYLFAYLGAKYPMYVHPGKTRFPRDTYLKALFISMDLVLVFEIFEYWVLYRYATEGILIGMEYTMLFVMLIVFVPVGYLLTKWRR